MFDDNAIDGSAKANGKSNGKSNNIDLQSQAANLFDAPVCDDKRLPDDKRALDDGQKAYDVDSMYSGKKNPKNNLKPKEMRPPVPNGRYPINIDHTTKCSIILVVLDKNGKPLLAPDGKAYRPIICTYNNGNGKGKKEQKHFALKHTNAANTFCEYGVILGAELEIYKSSNYIKDLRVKAPNGDILVAHYIKGYKDNNRFDWGKFAKDYSASRETKNTKFDNAEGQDINTKGQPKALVKSECVSDDDELKFLERRLLNSTVREFYRKFKDKELCDTPEEKNFLKALKKKAEITHEPYQVQPPSFVIKGKNRSDFHNFQPDFQICRKGSLLLIEIDGGIHYGKSMREEDSRIECMRTAGYYVVRFNNEQCSSVEKASECVESAYEQHDKFLASRGK